MDNLASLLVQIINGMASASALFMLAAGLALIFGVTRIVNFAHGAFFMLGLYTAIHLNAFLLDAFALEGLLPRASAFWGSMVLSAGVVGAGAALLERSVLRRLYAVPELFQLLASFAWVLILQDAVLWVWGAEEVLGHRAPGMSGHFSFGERSVPSYDVFLVLAAPVLAVGLHLWLTRSRLGLHIRAASEDREMAQALGVRQGALFCVTFALGCGLAALGGALQMPREPASTALALAVVGDAFVVVVVGGMGSLKGAYLAAVAVGVLKSLCIWLGTQEVLGLTVVFPKLTQVVEFLLMAVVLAVRPQGLFGTQESLNTSVLANEYRPLKRLSGPYLAALMAMLGCLIALACLLPQGSYGLTLMVEAAIAFLFALSLHWLLAPSGMVSFGHAALFGVGAYAAGLWITHGWIVALLVGASSGAFLGIVSALLTAQMTGVYRAMLTLAIAQLLWSASIQWDNLTGGSNGLTGVWPPPPFDQTKPLLWLTLSLCVAATLAAAWALRSRWGLQLRALRDSPQRAVSLGLQARWLRTSSFAASGWCAGLAGALYTFSKGTVAPDVLAVHQSVNALVMVLLGGVNTLTAAFSGATAWVLLSDWILRSVPYWRAALGGTILLMVLLLPNGISGLLEYRPLRKPSPHNKQEPRYV